MVAHAVALGGEGDSIATEDKARTLVEVTAVGEVGERAIFDIEQGDISVGVVHASNHFEGYPLAVGRPCVGKVSVILQIGGAIGEFLYLAALEVEHGEDMAVENESQGVAVGRHLGLGALVLVGFEYRGLGEQGGVGKVGLLIGTRKYSLVDIVATVALRGIVESLAVGRPTDVTLCLGGVADLACGRIFNRGNEYVAAINEGDGLAIGRCHRLCGAAARCQFVYLGSGIVGDIDSHLDGICTRSHGVYFAVPGKCQGTGIGAREEAHRMSLELGECCGCIGVGE